MVFLPLLFVLIRFNVLAIWIVLYPLALTVKGAIEDHRRSPLLLLGLPQVATPADVQGWPPAVPRQKIGRIGAIESTGARLPGRPAADVAIPEVSPCRGPMLFGEIEHVEQIADRRAVCRHIRIVRLRLGVRQIISTAIREPRQMPISLDEFEHRHVIGIRMRYFAAARIR